MQSIRDQEEEGEHILYLDLQSVQTAAQEAAGARLQNWGHITTVSTQAIKVRLSHH